MRTAAQLIDDQGGPAAMAKKLDKSSGAIRQWKLENRIPRSCWPDILAVFPDLTMRELLASEEFPSRSQRLKAEAA